MRPERATAGCSVTVLQAKVRFTKAHRRTATGWATSGYGNARVVDARSFPVGGLDQIGRMLEWLAVRPDRCVIRGELAFGVDPHGCERRSRTEPVTFVEKPRRWLMIDADDIAEPAGASMIVEPEACVEHVLGMLPEAFQDVSCRWQASASAGVKPGCRLHLWFWLSEAITCGQAKTWLRRCPVDRSLYNPVQPHYTADPLFLDGSPGPLHRRRGLRVGLDDTAGVPAGLEEAPHLEVVPAPLTGAEPDTEAAAAAVRRSPAVRQIWTGDRTFRDRSTAHYALGCALASAGVRDPDTIRAIIEAYDIKHGRDPGKIRRIDYAERTIGAVLAKTS